MCQNFCNKATVHVVLNVTILLYVPMMQVERREGYLIGSKELKYNPGLIVPLRSVCPRANKM